MSTTDDVDNATAEAKAEVKQQQPMDADGVAETKATSSGTGADVDAKDGDNASSAKRKSIPKKVGTQAPAKRLKETPGQKITSDMVKSLMLSNLSPLAPDIDDAATIRKHLRDIHRRVETIFSLTATVGEQVLSLLLNTRATTTQNERVYAHAVKLTANYFPNGVFPARLNYSLNDAFNQLSSAAASQSDAKEAAAEIERITQGDKPLRVHLQAFRDLVMRVDLNANPMVGILQHLARSLREDGIKLQATLMQSRDAYLSQWLDKCDPSASLLDKHIHAIQAYGDATAQIMTPTIAPMSATAPAVASVPVISAVPVAPAANAPDTAQQAPKGRNHQRPQRVCTNCPGLNNHDTAHCRKLKPRHGTHPVHASCLAQGIRPESLNLFWPLLLANLQITQDKDEPREIQAPRVDATQSITVQATLNDVPVISLIDTGAVAASFVTASFINKLNLPLPTAHDGNISLVLADTAVRPTYGWSLPIQVQIGNKQHVSKFIIVDELLGHDVVLGLPDLTQMGLLTLHLPNPLVEQEQKSDEPHQSRLKLVARDEDEYREEDPSWSSKRNATESDVEPEPAYVQELRKVIQPLVDENQTIQGFAKYPPVRLRMLQKPHTAVYRRQYKIPYAACSAVDEQITKWLSKGKIKPVSSPYNLPLTTAPKMDAAGNKTGTRVCLDPRAINQYIEPDNFPIPPTREIIDSLKGNKFFTEVDLEDAFLQMRLSDEDQEYLCFTWNKTQYSFQGAPYGVKVMSAQFQRLISRVLAGYDFAQCYIDNIIIASKTLEEHTQHVQLVLQRLNEFNLRISPKKLKLARQSLCILGYKVTDKGFETDPRKVRQVLAWPFPSTCKGLQKFMGVCNYLRTHIRNISELSTPLNRARNSEADFIRELANNGDNMRLAFDNIKQAIAHTPVLSWPDLNRPMHLAIDASITGIGGVLYQPTIQQELKGDTSITSECLAMVFAITEFHQYLWGRHFHIHTDHQALVALRGSLKTAENSWFMASDTPGI